MSKHGDLPTHGDLNAKVRESEEDLDEQREVVGKTVDDAETTAGVLDALEGATQDGADRVEGNVRDAQGQSISEYGEASGELEERQGENQEVEDDLRERSETVSTDVEKIRSASERIHSDAANRELSSAENEGLSEIGFLDDEADHDREAREESKRAHEAHEARVNAARRP